MDKLLKQYLQIVEEKYSSIYPEMVVLFCYLVSVLNEIDEAFGVLDDKVSLMDADLEVLKLWRDQHGD